MMASGRAGLLWALLLSAAALAARPAEGAAFLQNQLPLEVLLATPSELISNDSSTVITVEDRQAFTAVFSRPVIALGSDFGQEELPASLVPFKVDCPVPGRLRWVTTNIARWDPTIAWPTDVDCRLAWNKDLKTFDGAPLQLGGLRPVTLRSSPLSFKVASVASARADNLTDGQWNAYRGMTGDNFPEVPPDANVTLQFSYPVQLALLRSALKVASCCGSDTGGSQKLTVLPCGPPYVVPDPFAAPAQQAAQRENSTCAVVVLEPGLPAGAGAILRLPKGAKYSAVSGPTRNDTDVYLWGLRRFRIPLRDNFQQLANATEQVAYQDNVISFRRLLMWLPHGLAAGVTASQLSRSMWFCKYDNPYDWGSKCREMPFELELANRGQLLMTVPSLAVRQHYQLRVLADPRIKDGYGLSLEESAAYFFTAEPSPDMSGPELASGSQVMILEPSPGNKSLDWPIVYRGRAQNEWDANAAFQWTLADLGNMTAAMRLAGGSYNRGEVDKLLGKPEQALVRPYSQTAQTYAMSLSGRPGVQLVAGITNSSWSALTSPMIVVQSDLQYAGISIGPRLTHFVTTTAGGAAPVAAAKVSLFLMTSDKSIPAPSCSTGADGTCTVDTRDLTAGGVWGQLGAVVEAAGHGPLVVWMLQLPDSYESASSTYPYVGELVLDRAIVMPGDKLHLTGFVQERGGKAGRLALPAGLSALNLTFTPSLTPGLSEKPTTFAVKLNASYGSFHIVVPFPADATPGQYALSLTAPRTRPGGDGGGDDEPAEIASASITVGTPRPPTATLNITAPDWTPPNSTVKVLIKASSYLGADVGGATMGLKWSLPAASGVINVTTDARGLAEASVPLGALPPQNATQLGETLGLSVEWVGPTRERIVETRSVKIANGPVRVELTRSPTTDVPGVPFIMSAATWLNDRDGTRVEGVLVEVSLAPNSSDSLANCSAASAALLAAQRCSVVSGAPAPARPCIITLPCEANLKLVACPVAFANGTKIVGAGGGAACSETPIGRNSSAWQASPWSLLPKLELLSDRRNYSVGSWASLSWSNAYWRPATGVLVWGNRRLQRQRALGAVPVGPGSANITLGEECVGGCRVTLVLSLPRPGSGGGGEAAPQVAPLALRVPSGRLFDPLAPATASASVALEVLEDNRLNVSLVVRPAGAAGASGAAAALPAGLFRASAPGPDGRPVPVMRPSSDAEIQVKVVDSATGEPAVDAEVTVVVVDGAILDLLPYPLPDIAADLVDSSYIPNFVKELNDARSSRANFNATFSVLQRRLALDPWLPIVTTVAPSQSVSYAPWGSRTTAFYPTTSPVDIPDDQYLKGFTNSLTTTPFYTWGLSQRYPAGSGTAGDAGAALRLSSEFQTTPLFAVAKAATDGSATVSFRAPPNLSTFVVRAYAVTKGSPDRPSKYGGNETQVVVRQSLSLTPSVPKAVRVGDDFEAGVLVSAPDAAGPVQVELAATVAAGGQQAGNGTAKAAEPDGSLVLLPSDPVVQTVTVSPSQQQVEARFRFQAKAIGASGLRFVARVAAAGAKAGGGAAVVADAVQEDVEVLGQQGSVYVATSFSLQAGANATGRQEGLALPQAAPGSGTVELLAGVGYLPAIKVSYDALVRQQSTAAAALDDPASYVPYGADAVSTALLPAFLSRYSGGGGGGGQLAKSLSAPLATPAQLNASAAAARAAAVKLTTPESGLMYYKPWAAGGAPPSPSVRLSSWASWLLGQAQQAAAGGGAAAALPYGGELANASALWRAAAAEQLVKDAEAARAPPVNEAFRPEVEPERTYSNYEDLSWARLALGAGWAPPKGTPQAVAADLSLSRQVAAATTPKNTSVGVQARTGLVLLQVAKAGGAPGVGAADAGAAADKLARALLGSLRISGRTAYIASEPGAASAAADEDQALALLFLAQRPQAPATREALPKLAAYVAGGKGGIGGGAAAATCVSVGGTGPGTAAAALSTYDETRGSTAPDAKLTVTAVSGGNGTGTGAAAAVPAQAAGGASKVLLSATFTPGGAAALANSSTPWSALPRPAPQLRFEVSGSSGEVSVAAGLDFTPAKLLPFPSYRGLWVERAVQREGGGGNLAAAALADVVTVSVQVTSPDAARDVLVDVLMPGGLEPVDPNVYRDEGAQAACDLGSGWWSWWCPAQTTARSKVTFRFDYLGAGTVNVKFKAIAATPGIFVLPPVKAYSASDPSLMGLSAAGSFTVCPGRSSANAAAAAAGIAKTPGAAAFSQCAAGAATQAPLPAARGCPSDCSSNGVCNLLTGACLCNAGFGGPACAEFKAA